MAKNQTKATSKKNPKPAPEKLVDAKKRAASGKSSAVSVKLSESFIRDFSLECFLPPHQQPSKNRELDFTISAAVRPLSSERSSVGVAIRLRVSGSDKVPFAVAEMIQEGVFDSAYENEKNRERLLVDGAQQVYAQARKNMLNLLSESRIAPPLPEEVDFQKMVQKDNV